MAPDERRAAIIAATVPLLREHGLSVSTRQIAEAAGVAEGTIFGVFPDKGSLIRSAIVSTFDAEPAVRALARIDPRMDLRERLVAALNLLRPRIQRNAALVGAFWAGGRRVAPSAEDAERMREFFAQLHHSRRRILEALAALIEPDGARLRRRSMEAAHMLFMMMMTDARGFFGATEPLESEEIVTLLLDGLLVRPEEGRG
jgi:AcrR family transcriptional regulator